MKSYVALIAAAGIASVPAVAGYEYLDIVPLEARQATGEKFACHEDCGYAILGSANGDAHCTNSTWLTLLDECLECANEFDIWQHYGNGVEKGAEACDLEAVPVAAAADASADSSAAAETTAEPTAEATSTPSAEAADEDSAAAQLTSSSVMLFAMIAAAGLL
ncbi:hypothetical protein ACHAQA_006236 [Verticillium albo-atrum]